MAFLQNLFVNAVLFCVPATFLFVMTFGGYELLCVAIPAARKFNLTPRKIMINSALAGFTASIFIY
jgi:hypothetical protein